MLYIEKLYLKVAKVISISQDLDSSESLTLATFFQIGNQKGYSTIQYKESQGKPAVRLKVCS